MSNSQRRSLQVWKALKGHEVEGIKLTAISTKMNLNKSIVLRDLQVLAKEGFAEQLDNKNWRVNPRLGRYSFVIQDSITQAQRRLEEDRKRYFPEQ